MSKPSTTSTTFTAAPGKVTAAIQRYGPGEAATDGQPGDFILTHGGKLYDRLTQWAQSLRMHGGDRKYTRWNHAAILVDTHGAIIEADGKGVCLENLSKYQPTEYYLVHIDASQEDRAEEVSFARSCLGKPYGKVTICSIFLSLITGTTLAFGLDGTEICSGLVAQSLVRTNVIFDKDPTHIMPADLAKYFKVEPPAKGTPIGKAPR